MKKLLLIAGLLITFISCKNEYEGKRVYEDSHEMWEKAHDKYYGDYVNAWGEPTDQFRAGFGKDEVFMCIWDSSKVNVGQCPSITVEFNILEASNGNGVTQASPFQPIRYRTCDGKGENEGFQ